jgi:hypothetical protein
MKNNDDNQEFDDLKRDTFIIYRSFYEAMKPFDDSVKAKLFDAMCEFSLNGEDVELEGVAASLFMLMRPNLEANNKRYLNGSKAKPKQTRSKTEAKPKQKASKAEANKDKDKDKDEDKDKDKSGAIPTFFEFFKYAYSKNPKVDRAKLEMKYEAWKESGWCIPRNGKLEPIKIWKTTLLNTMTYGNLDSDPKENFKRL